MLKGLAVEGWLRLVFVILGEELMLWQERLLLLLSLSAQLPKIEAVCQCDWKYLYVTVYPREVSDTQYLYTARGTAKKKVSLKNSNNVTQ